MEGLVEQSHARKPYHYLRMIVIGIEIYRIIPFRLKIKINDNSIDYINDSFLYVLLPTITLIPNNS